MTQLTQLILKKRSLILASVITTLLQVAGTLFVPTIMSDIVNRGVLKEDLSYMYQAGIKMILVAVITAIMSVLGAYYASTLAAAFDKDMRRCLFSKVQQLSMADFEYFGTASLITRCSSDINQIQEAIIMIIQMVLPVPLVVIGGFILTFFIDFTLALILIVAVILFLIITSIFANQVLPIFKTIQKKLDTVNRILRENIIGSRVIRAFHRSEYEVKRMNNSFKDYALSNIYANKLIAVLIPIVMIIMNFSTVAILWFGGIKLREGKLEIGDIIAVLQYAIIILTYLIMALITFVMINQSRACAERITEVLNYVGSEHNADSELAIDTITKLEFRNVSFQYAGAENPVLSDINFECVKEESVGIIGGTGSGKSTIGLLIPRILDVRLGTLLINETDLTRYSIHEIRNKIGYIPQKSFLFTGTIKDNIAYGNGDISDQDIVQASEIAQIDSYIRTLEKGYDTLIEQDGKNLSGGQKQRICIARALAGKKEIYIFDDCFSSLDNQTEALIVNEIKKQLKSSIVIIIAQRINTIKNANKIVLLDEGKIIGVGNHESLSRTNEAYKQIINSQLREALDHET